MAVPTERRCARNRWRKSPPGSSHKSQKATFAIAGGKKDTLLVFAGAESSPKLVEACSIARELGVSVAAVCGDKNEKLASAANEVFRIASSSPSMISALHSVLIHALCEALEPEYEALDVSAKSAVFEKSFLESAAVDRLLAADTAILSAITRAHELIAERTRSGGWVYFAGNGGSGADAIELCEKMGSTALPDGSLPRTKHFLDPSYLTCAYNDGYSPFSREMEEDRGENVLIVYSTSGKSENINKAVQEAKKQKTLTVALTGKDGGALTSLADICIVVRSENTGRIQEAHSLLGSLLIP